MQGSFGLWSLGTRTRRQVNKAMTRLKCDITARVKSRGKLCIDTLNQNVTEFSLSKNLYNLIGFKEITLLQ